MNTNELGQLITSMSNEEAADVSLYTKEAELFGSKIINGKKIAAEFLRLAGEEMVHREALRKIYPLPEMESSRTIQPGDSLRKALAIHIVRENDAIKIYNLLLGRPEIAPEHRLMIKGIIYEEMQHIGILEKYADAIK